MYPFMVLDVAHDADDEAIRTRYEQLIVEFSPERSPQMFRLIQNAYEQIKDERGRVRTRLYYFDETGEELLEDLPLWLEHRPRRRMSSEELSDFLRRAE
jgi:curved DNA-binding protein CbpA